MSATPSPLPSTYGHPSTHPTLVLFQQSQERKPFFVGKFTESASYFTDCPHCQAIQEIKFKNILMASWASQDRVAEPEFTTVANVFGIATDHLRDDQGLPGVVTQNCNGCSVSLFFHFRILETTDSQYAISLYAAASSEPSRSVQGHSYQVSPPATAAEA